MGASSCVVRQVRFSLVRLSAETARPWRLPTRTGEDTLRSPALHEIPGWCAVSPLTTASIAMIWWSGCRSSIRSSLPARGVETHNDLDDRALPDRLRLLNCNLDGHQAAPVPGEQRSGELSTADPDVDRHLAPVDQATGCLLQILAFLRRHGHKEVRRRPAPLDHLAGEGLLHAPIIRDVPLRRGHGSTPDVRVSVTSRRALSCRRARASGDHATMRDRVSTL